MVSFSVSPLEELVVEASEKPITLPPNLFTAVSKLRRVRVEGSKKRVATTFPSRILWSGCSSKNRARSNKSRMSSREMSSIETRLLLFIAQKNFRVNILLRKDTNFNSEYKNAVTMISQCLTSERNEAGMGVVKFISLRVIG